MRLFDPSLRRDFSNQLIHLTRGQNGLNALQVLEKILFSSPPGLKGGTSYVKGTHECVCFMETPLSEVSYMLKLNAAINSNKRPRYEDYGVAVPKQWLWDKGGRPVLYQPSSDYELMNDKIKFKHVTYDPPAVDFSWEREWRILTTFLELDPEQTTVIVKTHDDFEQLQRNHVEEMRLYVYHYGEDAIPAVQPFPWNVVVLDSL